MSESTWRSAVLHGHNVLSESTTTQRWYLISCVHTCVNVGPFRVWSSEGDVYWCAACGREMRQRREG